MRCQVGQESRGEGPANWRGADNDRRAQPRLGMPNANQSQHQLTIGSVFETANIFSRGDSCCYMG